MTPQTHFPSSSTFEQTLEQKGQLMALNLFHEAARRVPAYKDFLGKARVEPSKIKTIADFRQVPWVDKKNYLTQYSLPELCWDGDLFSSRIISVSSGSSGEPFFWPRGRDQDEEGSWMHEQLFRDVFQTHRQTTLVVICFSMGTWIAGSFTAASLMGLADKGQKLNIVTPGTEKSEAVKAVKRLGHLYDQVILCGYPPLLKDIVDQGLREGVDWKELKLRFMFAGEAFSEEWRDHVLGLVGSSDPYFDSANVYGSADAAMLGHETPVSIALRRIYGSHPDLTDSLFGLVHPPSLVQYYPDRRYFETVESEVIFSANAGIPLVRYNIHDTGRIHQLSELIAPVAQEYAQVTDQWPADAAPWQLPVISLGGRKDHTVTIYAVNVYPENIKSALLQPHLSQRLTGKFTMATKYKSDMDQYFEVHLELLPSEQPGEELRAAAQETIVSELKRLNAEYMKLTAVVGEKAHPRIHLVAHGDPDLFTIGAKHKWIKR